MENILLLLQLETKQNLRRFRQPVGRQEWMDYDPTTINAFYHPLLNKIDSKLSSLRIDYISHYSQSFLLVFFDHPASHKDAPKDLKYGAIEVIVGHEIAHGFDEFHRRMDKDIHHGRMKLSRCLINDHNVSLNKVNGKRTRDEIAVDNDGLRKAFYAYQKWNRRQKNIEKELPGLTKYSPEQMFFISFGQLCCSKVANKYTEEQLRSCVWL